MYKEKLDKILLKVQKPSRYIGGELYSVQKDPKDVSVRFAFCFPDTYDIGMSHLGMKILYSIINEVPRFWCERVFMPLPDMEQRMRDNDILLYGFRQRLVAGLVALHDFAAPFRHDYDVIVFVDYCHALSLYIIYNVGKSHFRGKATKKKSNCPTLLFSGCCSFFLPDC